MKRAAQTAGRARPMSPDALTLAACERALEERAVRWGGRCFEIASAIVDAKLVEGTAVYGHWLGPVHPRSRFAGKGPAPFVQHGWIVLPDDSRVLDPTRWAFEAVKPYLFLGLPGALYDEGGNRWRAAMRGPCPEWDPDAKQIELPSRKVPTAVWNFIERYLELDDPERVDSLIEDKAYVPGFVTKRQLAWLANAPLNELGTHAAGVYNALDAIGEIALIPIDNLRRVRSGRWP